MEINEMKAATLIDAMPYMKKYYNKVIVVKFGGNAMVSDEICDAVMKDIVLIQLIGIKVVLVHGGGPEINSAVSAMGHKSHFVDGLRYTDKTTAEIVQMVLCGKINKKLVALLQNNGGKALGICGVDGGMIEVKKLKSKVDLGFVGEVGKINPQLIIDAMNNNYIPVIASVAFDNSGQSYNINADSVAAAIASELKAENLTLLSDIEGVLRDKDDVTTLIGSIELNDLDKLLEDGTISGGMIPKIKCCKSALTGGVKKAFIVDGRKKHSIIIELFSNSGIGTMIYKEKK